MLWINKSLYFDTYFRTIPKQQSFHFITRGGLHQWNWKFGKNIYKQQFRTVIESHTDSLVTSDKCVKKSFSNFSVMFLNPNIFFFNLNSDCSIIWDLRNLQEHVKKAFGYQKLFWPFTVWINCSSDFKSFENFQPSYSVFKSFSHSGSEQFLVTKYQSYCWPCRKCENIHSFDMANNWNKTLTINHNFSQLNLLLGYVENVKRENLLCCRFYFE